MATTPNWADLTTLKTKQYCDQSSTDFDTVLTLLGQQITEQMIDFLDNEDEVDADNPPLSLKRACLMQVTYEFRRRKDLGLSSTTYTDGTVNKFQIDEFLPAVEKILQRHKFFSFGLA